MKNVLISACLIGIFSRYDGSKIEYLNISDYVGKVNFIPVCPEQLGGLSTPREPSERRSEKVFSSSGKDISLEYALGAEETLAIAKKLNCDTAILKFRSPSCGSGKIYDGTFSGKLIDGDGVTAELLKKAGIKVISEFEALEFLKIN